MASTNSCDDSYLPDHIELLFLVGQRPIIDKKLLCFDEREFRGASLNPAKTTGGPSTSTRFGMPSSVWPR